MVHLLFAALLIPQGHVHDSSANAAMSGPMTSTAHMRMTAARPRTTADSVRAMEIAETLRRELVRYKDPAAAERDGYRQFLPNVKNQRIYHFTKRRNGLIAAFHFSVDRPTSLLYTRDSTTGKLKLVGAMFTAPRGASEDALNKRVPLSVTQWHLHKNLCVPAKGQESRFTELRDGKPLFGLEGTIATKQACDAEHGRFYANLFGWMVHANVYEGTDLKAVWGHDDQKEHGEHKHP